MDSLFGSERASSLRSAIAEAGPGEREHLIESELARGLTTQWGRFVLQFRFKGPSGRRTRHHLVFVSKHQKGYDIMKDIMARESSASPQGVPTFEYNPAHHLCAPLFPDGPTARDLEEALPVEFAGQRLTMHDVYWRHNVGLPFISANYKTALANLEARGKITAMPQADKRMHIRGKLTFADDVVVQFPAR